VRFPFLALLNLAAISAVSAQWQPMPVPAVAGHPFSADEVTPRTLSPNLKIDVPSTSRVYRDSAGRTRVDVAFPRGRVAPPPIAVIIDPIAGITYSLNTETKIARQFVYPPVPALPATDDPWKPPTVRPATPIPEPSKVETLGPQQVAGLLAEGRRITTVFPATAHSIEQESVVEIWYSQELQMMVLQQTHTTALGDSTTRLENIDRSEPDPLLFRLPSDYTIVDFPRAAKATERFTGPVLPPMPPLEFPKLPPPPAK
jgi:hypothetical protein